MTNSKYETILFNSIDYKSTRIYFNVDAGSSVCLNPVNALLRGGGQ